MSDGKKTTSTSYIKNYGLLWKRDEVRWGGRKTDRGLFGKKTDSESLPINFSEQVGFYALYDEFFNLIYFGQVGANNKKGEEDKHRTLYKRLNEHRKYSLADRWFYFSWFGIKRVIKDDDKTTTNKFKLSPDATSNPQGGLDKFLNQIEAIVLEVAEPSRNKQSGAFSGAKKYFQYKNEKLSPTDEKLKNIQEQLNAIEKKLNGITKK